MIYEVTLDNEVDFAPVTEVDEILQNVRTILKIQQGTVPLDREFGLTWEHIDKPLPIARSLQQAAIIEAIEEYEPRATVQSVEFDNNVTDAMEGILKPRVIVSIGDDEEEDF